MNELTTYNEGNLPATLDDLAKFILIGQEKMKALQAEIRAITKAKLANDVYEQKLEEHRQLSELILVASTRLGELTDRIPKGSGGDRKSTEFKSSASATFDPRRTHATANFQSQTKQEQIADLGLSKWQVSRFETMASHPEEVAQARATAAAEKRPVTQTEVLSLIRYKEERARAEDRQIDEDARLAKQLTKALTPILLLPTDRSIPSRPCGGDPDRHRGRHHQRH